MDDPIREIFIDERIALYEGYLPDDWCAQVFEKVKPTPALERMLVDLILAWRTTAYTASMPVVAIKALQAGTLEYARVVSPDASIIAFAEGVLAKVSRKIPELVADRRLRTRLMEELVTTANEFRTARSSVTPEMPIEPIWREFLGERGFQMSVWSSQRVAYVAFYNAYEAFLVDCAKQVLGVSKLRATDKEFKEALRTGFGVDLFYPCWSHTEINNARLVRHALSHAGGRETAELKKQKHGIKIVDGVLQIVPHDNHNLLRRVRVAVDALIAAYPN